MPKIKVVVRPAGPKEERDTLNLDSFGIAQLQNALQNIEPGEEIIITKLGDVEETNDEDA